MKIATRGSALALAQAAWVAERLPGEHELVDRHDVGRPRRRPGRQGARVDAVERALLDGAADLAVHSAKDVPAQLRRAPYCSARRQREDPRDALLGELRPGARVGTSSLRRRAQLLATYDDIEVVELRGNVDTRLRKLADGEVDAAVLALAGLRRLGRAEGAQPLDLARPPDRGRWRCRRARAPRRCRSGPGRDRMPGGRARRRARARAPTAIRPSAPTAGRPAPVAWVGAADGAHGCATSSRATIPRRSGRPWPSGC